MVYTEKKAHFMRISKIYKLLLFALMWSEKLKIERKETWFHSNIKSISNQNGKNIQ